MERLPTPDRNSAATGELLDDRTVPKHGSSTLGWWLLLVRCPIPRSVLHRDILVLSMADVSTQSCLLASPSNASGRVPHSTLFSLGSRWCFPRPSRGMLDGAARTVIPTASLLQPSRLLRWQVEVFPVSPCLGLRSLGLASPTPYREARLLKLHTSSAVSDLCSWLCPDLCTPSRRICKQARAFTCRAI
jgi:hypothetical protein